MGNVDDLKKKRNEKTKKELLNLLLEHPNVIHLDPWLILYEQGDGIQVLRLEHGGVRKIFQDKL